MQTEIIYLDEDRINEEAIVKAAEAIRQSGTVIFPTETVYGLGANALSAEAVGKIFKAKGRPSDNPLIVHISCMDMLLYLIGEKLSDHAKCLMDNFWPGPLTLIFRKSKNVPDEVTAGLDTVAIRMPDHPIALQLIEKSGLPIAAPSANLSGKPSPTMAEHVVLDMDGRVDMILCGTQSRVGVESTVLDISGEIPVILRPGGITYEDLTEILGKVEIDPGLVSADTAPRSPGMKYTHYAPEADMVIVKGNDEKVSNYIQNRIDLDITAGKRVGVLAAEETRHQYRGCETLSMGYRNEAERAAAALFAALREFDRLEVDIIYAEALEESHIGMAVMNRMKKAAGFNIVEVE